MKYSLLMVHGWQLLVMAVTVSWTLVSAVATPATPSPSPDPTRKAFAASAQPQIESLLKPQVYERVVKKRDIMTHAVLDDYTPAPMPTPSPPALKKYTYYAAMLVHATPTRARQVLTDYSLYKKLIPYVQKSDFNSQTQILEMLGGVLGWTLHSWLHFEERNSSWIHFQVVAGHFQGMNGDIYFERYDDENTLVYLGGSQVLSQWPPKFILENGEEIVFGFTATRMRSYMETPEPTPKGTKGKPNNDGLPQPRSHL